ncbi:MAG TPA: N,N-dimethylformamidase beta subunit family domain-containing protein [Terriglobia bacterium]|nr:N,N-dimethylformamidase beta subunit family domain-containing protein [Terriglobia bacterium]
MRPAYARVLFLIFMFFGWAWIPPLQAVPQLLPLLDGLVVTITDPASGSTVSSTITVKASVGPLGVLVAGVQFKLDGVDLGAEDTTAPYSVPWDTSTASNDTHTLTAVARNMLGLRFTSGPVRVTVFNDKTPPTVAITSPNAGSIVAGPIDVSATASDDVAVAGVQFKLDGLDLGAEDTTAPYSVPWDTSTATNNTHTLTAVARDSAGNRTTSSPVTVRVLNESPVMVENRQPGSWRWTTSVPGLSIADDISKQIKGYASATSVNKGESITFYVTLSPAQTYTMDVYRMGWYQGDGGRLLQQIGPLNGAQQPACPVDSVTGLIECAWTPSYTLTVPTTWTSGVFLVKLTNEQGYQNYINFVVRDDARRAGILYQQAVTNYQAHNNYPDDGATGKSLLDRNSFGANTMAGTRRAVKVSWNRPYKGDGSGRYFYHDYYFIRWLERTGYDVIYSTDVDTHQNSARLLNSKAFLTVGLDEYWSKAMYDGVERARDAGVHLGFFGGKTVHWQVRFEVSPVTGGADRVIVCYKDRPLDPIQGPTTTINWRDPFLNRPEQQLIGVQTSGTLRFSNAPYVVTRSSSWVYEGTGLIDGDSIPGLVGDEVDSSMSTAPLPISVAGTYEVLSQSPFEEYSGERLYANSSIYRAPSGAWVFGAGTISWSFGLDRSDTADSRIQRITANLLKRFLGGSTPP